MRHVRSFLRGHSKNSNQQIIPATRPSTNPTRDPPDGHADKLMLSARNHAAAAKAAKPQPMIHGTCGRKFSPVMSIETILGERWD
jgi:hypothetical protein